MVTTPPHQPDSIFMTVVPTLPPASTLRMYDSSPPDYLSPIRTYSANKQAQNHVWNSWGVESVAEKFKLCQKALAVFPFSVDAYNCMGNLYREAIPHQGQVAQDNAEQAYTYAVEAANLLWPELKSQESIEWGCIQLRPFLRAYHGLACLQDDIGKFEESREIFRFLLRVNPGDNQGVRYLLFYNLIQAGEYQEAEEVAEKHSNGRESNEAYFLWGFVLIDFLKNKLGFCPKEDLEKTLIVALRSNNHVIPLLLTKQKPELPATTSPSGMDEARSIVSMMIVTVLRLPGALEWMEDTIFRSGMKPDDDGSILFKLLQNGRILVEMKSGKKIEVTSDVRAMPGKGLGEFCLAPGMKDHNPEKIVGFNQNAEGRGVLFTTNFTSFSYDDVKSIPFWDVRRTLEKSIRHAEKRYCACCHKDANLQCTACKAVWYCSRDCKKKHWKGKDGSLGPSHKIMCKKFVKT
mmetsp:Transcript_14002/g.32663  ORF Transcript_14002/g.32663 Transcript_14002/m.32663 type:complete len:462 (+) Transcript_14002:231-1616(+)